MINIKTVKNKKELKKVFDFLSMTFYDDAKKNNEYYFTMSERHMEMEKQLEVDNELLMYIEEDKKIIAAITGKGMDTEKKKITLGVIAIDPNYRKKGYAKALINEFEKRCKDKGIKHIDLGARFRACPLYIKLGYKPSLMIQVFDFANIDDVKKANKFNLKEGFSWQSDAYGFIFFEIDEIKEEYIDWFEQNVKTAHAQYIFEKDL